MRRSNHKSHASSIISHAGPAAAATAMAVIGEPSVEAPATPSLLYFGTDRALRRRLFVSPRWVHPAKLHLHLVQWLVERSTAPGDTILEHWFDAVGPAGAAGRGAV